MADNQPVSNTPNLHALGLLGGSTSGAKGAPTNHGEDGPEKIFKDGLDNVVNIAKTIPILGSLIGKFLPSNAGSVSVFGSFDTQGFTSGTIVRTSGGTGNGLLGKFIADLAKNGSKITDHTGGISPSAAQDMMASMQNISPASLGTLTPLAGGGASQSIEMSV